MPAWAAAFAAKLAEIILKKFVQYVIVPLYKRAKIEAETSHQRKLDEEKKASYDNAIKNGTLEDIRNETEKRLNS